MGLFDDLKPSYFENGNVSKFPHASEKLGKRF